MPNIRTALIPFFAVLNEIFYALGKNWFSLGLGTGKEKQASFEVLKVTQYPQV